MATTGHESEIINVSDLKAALQKYKTTISDTKLNSSLKGAVNGLAELDSNGKVPSSQLPSYVDDVVEGYYYNDKFYQELAHTTEITGEGGKIYVDLATEKTYRYSGSAYVQIKGDIVIGTSTGTAADGKVVNDHITDSVVHITAAERIAWNAKGSYSKPSGGIPKTDLASDVQTSLGKADTALLSSDITGKADVATTVTNVAYDSANSKITKTINGTTSDVITIGDIASALTAAGNELTDTKVTSVSNHYTPTTGSSLTTTLGTAASATAGTSYDVVTGVTLTADAAGHIISVSTERLKVVSNSTTDISGKQDTVPKLGSTTKPVYTSAAGTFAECSTYAGGTAVTLNGTDKGASTASFYAPTAVGTSGLVLTSSGSGAPTWLSVASTTTCQDIVTELT